MIHERGQRDRASLPLRNENVVDTKDDSTRMLPMSNAERQRAHRQRVKARLAGLAVSSAAPKPKRPPPKPSRPKRLAALEQELSALLAEYEHWLDSLPDNLAESGPAEQLRDTIDNLQVALDAVGAIEPPRVGR